MKLYESVFIVRQDVTAAQVESLTQNYVKLIRDEGGEVSKTEFIGLRNLAYTIKKNKKGHYVLMNISANPSTILEMERLMKLNEDIIRYMTLTTESHDNTPSPLMQQKHYKDDRSRYADEEFEDDVAATA
jgi:small subunit ribosomal protein S6